MIRAILFIVLSVMSSVSMAEISRYNYVDWVVASSKSSSDSHFIQWKNSLQNPGDCKASNGTYRTRISMEDKELFSLLLTAKVAEKKVGFYYNTTSTTGPLPGHGSDCQITNAWLESE